MKAPHRLLIKPSKLFLLLSAFLLILASCRAETAGTNNVSGSAPPRFLWEVKGGAGIVYLTGTVHVLKNGYAIAPEILDLFDTAGSLAVESNTLSPQVSLGVMDYMYYSDGSLLFDHLSIRAQRHLTNMAELYGLDIGSMQYYHASNVPSLFLAQASKNGGYQSPGVDMQLLLLATEQFKPILELEDYRDTLGSFHTLPDDTLERVCIPSIPSPGELQKELDDMYNLYISGDAEGMLEYMSNEPTGTGGDGLPVEYEEKDGLYDTYMLENRNKTMSDSIIGYLEKPGITFVAAGLAHFLGEGSIIELLESRGYIVERI